MDINIIITGSVGCGKSTFINHLLPKIKQFTDWVKYYPEFLHDDPLASELIKRRFTNDSNKISPLTFQSYIMDKWLYYGKKNEHSGGYLCIYERLPDDAVEVFAKPLLTVAEFQTQLDKLKNIYQYIPVSYYIMKSYETIWIIFNNDFIHKTEDEDIKTLNKLTDTIINIIRQYKHRYIVVEIRSPTNPYNTMEIRKRDGEIYTTDDITALNERYNKYLEIHRLRIDCETLKIE